MANKKFSEFTLKTSTSDVDFVVGYDGTDNVRIAPTNLAPVTSVNSLTGAVSLGLTELDDVGSDGTNGQVLTTNGSGSFTFQDAGGGGASDLNGLSDCLVDTDSLYVGEVPAGLSGNPQGNTILGIDAGNALTTGTNNTLIGKNAGDAITTSGSNVAIGRNALGKTTSSQLTAVGDSAGSENISGQKNVYIGYAAGQGNATGFNNCYVGYAAGAQNQSGDRNTALGTLAGLGTFFNAAIGNNTSLGYAAGTALSTGGDGNTLVGCLAGNTLTTGSNNLILGESSAPSAVTVDNEITLGNSSISALRCAVTSITSLSDERDKSEIKDLEYGLAFIDALQPREFVWDNRVETKTEYDDDGNETQVEFYSANKGKKDFGFIAQEVRELDNDTLRLVYAENEDKLEMSYGKLVPILVKAIQELKEEVELLKG